MTTDKQIAELDLFDKVLNRIKYELIHCDNEIEIPFGQGCFVLCKKFFYDGEVATVDTWYDLIEEKFTGKNEELYSYIEAWYLANA